MARSKESVKPSLTSLAARLDTRKRPVSVAVGGAVQPSALRLPEKRAVIEARLSEPRLPSAAASRPLAERQSVAKALLPPRAPIKPVTKATGAVLRADALTNLRATEPSPSRGQKSKRSFPRKPVAVRARLRLAEADGRVFEASLPTSNVSVGGLFFESTFFLKLGTRLEVDLTLPPDNRTVRVKGEVVRVESKAAASGFAIRFLEYLDGSEVVLATHFLSPVLRAFLTDYAEKHHFSPTADFLSHTADILAAWELQKAASGGDVWSLATTL
jgi:PilZ domain